MDWSLYWTLIAQIALASLLLFMPLGFLAWFLVRSAGFGLMSVLAQMTKQMVELRGESLKKQEKNIL